MFHPPILNIQNIHPGTRVGIEIEICIKKEKYIKLNRGKALSEYPEFFYKFNHDNPFEVGRNDSLHRIIFTTDPTCICREGFINAEIISPKMDYRELPLYLNFLKKKVFNNPDDYYQGETCGIHIHWSNEDLMLNKDVKYLFLFFKLIHNLREKLDFKLINSHFSGRQFFYNGANPDLVLSTNAIQTKKHFIDYQYIKIDDVINKTLDQLLINLNNTKVDVYKNKSFTKEIFYQSILKKLLKNIELCVLIYLFVLSNFNYFTGNDNIDIVFNEDYTNMKLKEFEIVEIDEGILKESINKYLRILLDLDSFKNKRDEEKFNKINILFLDKFFYENILGGKIKDDFSKFYGDIINGIDYFRDQDENAHRMELFYQDFRGHIEKEESKLREYKTFTQSDLIYLLMITQKKLPDISIYNIDEGFHVEMRMFSLDSLLYGKTKVPVDTLINELTRFVLYTDNLMMNVITVLNQVYDSKTEIKRDKRELLNNTLLFGERNSKNQIKKIGRRLFAMDLVDTTTSRHLRSPVGHPGSKLKNHRKPSLGNLNYSRNQSTKSRKSKKKQPKKETTEMTVIEDNNLFDRSTQPTKPPSPRVSRSGKILSRRQMGREKSQQKRPSTSQRTKRKSHRPKSFIQSSE